MTIQIKKYDSFDTALHILQQMSLDKDIVVFRGQQDINWRLHTTIARYKKIKNKSAGSDIDFLLDQFKTNLAKLGQLPFQNDNRLDWLEFAQHHGVPTPYLDFTYSPYVALFFAFNELKFMYEQHSEYVVIYCLNVTQLARHQATRNGTFNQQAYEDFLYPSDHLFENGFPENVLQFIPQPGKRNARMQRQQGAFLYDTLDYQAFGLKDLEAFIDKITPYEKPILSKVFIHKQCVKEAFQILELMNITGTMLFLDSSGAAMDVKNAYYYHPKTMLLRDFNGPSSKE